jgi:hypothetical protein
VIDQKYEETGGERGRLVKVGDLGVGEINESIAGDLNSSSVHWAK